MKKRLFYLCFLLLTVSLFASANSERQCTHTEFAEPIFNPTTSLQQYSPPIELDDINATQPNANRDEWELIDSVGFDSFIPTGGYMGVFYNNNNHSINVVKNTGDINETARLAILKAPKWMRPDLENTFRQLSDEKQEVFGQLILDASDPYIDEIAFVIAHISVMYLESQYCNPQLFVENAHLIYSTDLDLSYVQVINYGNSANDENYYSTTRYWKKDENGQNVQVEVPRDIYYWYIVHPKITDEIPAYIDPDVVESNTTHTNNITDPGQGYFWRNYLYNHNDEGYPKLKYYLMACNLAWDGTSDISNAIGAITNWIGSTLEFTSNNERPHQPVRIYKKHIGRCGEHADFRAAAARIALLPATSILSISTDHTWNEFWDERWVHWDGGDIDTPLMYESGWGKVFGTVFEIRSDGLLSSVTATYSEGVSDLTVYVLDGNEQPVDGARIILYMQDGSNLRTDMIGVTDNDGKYTFIVGDNRSYYAVMGSVIGSYPGSGQAELVQNTQGGQNYTYAMHLDGLMPQPECTEIDPPEDTTDDFRLVVEYDVSNEVKYGVIPMDDIGAAYFNHSIEPNDGVNFSIFNQMGFIAFTSGAGYEGFYPAYNEGSADVSFDIPGGNYYALIDNKCHVRNHQRITGSFKLYNYDDAAGIGTISGTITDAFSDSPVSGARVEAGIAETTTNANGEFSLEIAPGTFSVMVHAPGYFPMIVDDITVANGQVATVDIGLGEKAFPPREVIAATEGLNSEISWQLPEPVLSDNIQGIKKTQSNANRDGNRELAGYNIWRSALNEDAGIVEWLSIAENITGTSHTDASWGMALPGIYVYAVEAVYSGGNVSEKVISNEIYKNMTVPVAFAITTNSGDSAENASITFSNINDYPFHQYTIFADEDGNAEHEEIWKGRYNITVHLDCFNDIIIEDTLLNTPQDFTLQLIEKLSPPTNLAVLDYIFTWDNVMADEDGLPTRDFIEYMVFLGDTQIASITEEEYDFSGNTGEQTASVMVLYATGASQMASIDFIDGYSTVCGISGRYLFDGNADDSSPNGFHGTVEGATFIDDDDFGTVAEFDGVNDFIDLGTSPQTTGNEPRSFMAWARPEAFNGGGIFQAGATGTVGYDCSFRTMGAVDMWRAQFWGEPDFDVITPGSLNNWHFYTVTRSGERTTVYYDGEVVGYEDMVVNTPAHNIWIGRWDGSYFNGQIDDFSAWDRCIGPTEIGHIYYEQAPFHGAIHGTVTSAIDQTPVEGAVVSAGPFKAVTASDGSYSLDVVAREYAMKVIVPYYAEEITEGVVVPDDGDVEVNFEYSFNGMNPNQSIARKESDVHHYPNPFNPVTNIVFQVKESSNVSLEIYNAKGQLIKTLVNKEMSPGTHSVIWDGKNNAMESVSSGIYFYRYTEGDNNPVTRKMLLMK